MSNDNPMDEIEFQSYQPKPVKYLSEEVKEVFGCKIPNIDLFQNDHAIIGIPRDIISEIIHKGNPMRLMSSPFTNGNDIADAFERTVRMIDCDMNEIIDYFVGIFLNKNVKVLPEDLLNFEKRLDDTLGKYLDPIWGIYRQDELPEGFGQVITVVTKKREKK